MEVRLNKLISDAGICSRREADKYIEEGRVTVNGRLPRVGQKVTEADIVMLDDIQVKFGKHTVKQASSVRSRIQEPELAGQGKRAKSPATATPDKKTASPATGSKGLRPGKYVKYNKYAAARHAARNGESTQKEGKPKRTATRHKPKGE